MADLAHKPNQIGYIHFRIFTWQTLSYLDHTGLQVACDWCENV